MIIDIANITPYNWGEQFQAWKLVDAPALSVIFEEMPAGAAEVLHKHIYVQQLFFILEGNATFNLDGVEYELTANQSIYAYPGQAHFIQNKSAGPIKFLVISNPHSHHDRVDL